MLPSEMLVRPIVEELNQRQNIDSWNEKYIHPSLDNASKEPSANTTCQSFLSESTSVVHCSIECPSW